MSSQVTLTISNQLFRRAKELTQVRKEKSTDELADLLDEILASVDGDEEGMDVATWLDDDPAVAYEMQAYLDMHPMLKKTHFGKHVAIHNGKLVDVDDDYDRLTRRIDTQYSDRFVWVSTVEEEPIRSFTFRSPRIEEVE